MSKRIERPPAPQPVRDRPILPVSKSVGGVQPGIDLDDSAALQELNDLDYVKRMLRRKPAT
jgi:hypothetical protein